MDYDMSDVEQDLFPDLVQLHKELSDRVSKVDWASVSSGVLEQIDFLVNLDRESRMA